MYNPLISLLFFCISSFIMIAHASDTCLLSMSEVCAVYSTVAHDSPIHSIYLIGDYNIQTLVFYQRLSIYLIMYSLLIQICCYVVYSWVNYTLNTIATQNWHPYIWCIDNWLYDASGTCMEERALSSWPITVASLFSRGSTELKDSSEWRKVTAQKDGIHWACVMMCPARGVL